MSDIVERLQAAYETEFTVLFRHDNANWRGLLREAANTIEALRAQLQTALDRETATTARYDARVAELEAERDLPKAEVLKHTLDKLELLDSTAQIKMRAFIRELEAENARLRATNETLQRQNDIAEARVRAWHGAVYMVDQNPKLRPVQPTPFGDDVPPILALRSEKLITLLDKVNRLREALEPFSVMAGPLFMANYNDNDVLFDPNLTCESGTKPRLTFGDFRRAREALKETK